MSIEAEKENVLRLCAEVMDAQQAIDKANREINEMRREHGVKPGESLLAALGIEWPFGETLLGLLDAP